MSSTKSPGGTSSRACRLCRQRKMKCSGDRPWCTTCKEKNRPCIYDDGAIGVRKQKAEERLAVTRATSIVPFRSSDRDATLYQELVRIMHTHWSGNSGAWRPKAIGSRPEGQQQAAAVDFQRGISQILKMTVDSLVIESLPFGQRLQVFAPTASLLLSSQGSPRVDEFQHYSPQQLRPFTDDELLRHPQIYEIAFNSHPFLALILCRTIFLGDVEERAYDKIIYDAVLLAGLGAKEALAHDNPGTHAEAYGLPDMDGLLRRISSALYASKVASLKAANLHTYVQGMMIVAWHELTHGLVRRAATWWTVICRMIHTIRALKSQEKSRAGCLINGIDMSFIVAEELQNMQTIAHLVLLWLELSLGPILTQSPLVSYISLQRASNESTSWILELDDRSGKISTTEAYQRSSTLVRSIESVLGSLTESFNEWKADNGFVELRSIPVTAHRNTAHKVHAILSQARQLQSCSASTSSIEPSAAALVSLTALLACFRSRHAAVSMSEQCVTNIVKVCSAMTLQLRDAFGDLELSTFTAAHGLGTNMKKSSSRGCAYFADTMNGGHIVLTMIETIALTFEILLSHVGSDGLDDPSCTPELVTWPHKAQETVAGKLGNILGILSTVREFFDNIPKQGRRPSHILAKLDRLKERLEKLGVQPDVSFAFEVAFAREELDSPQGEGSAAVKQETVPVLRPYEVVPLHCSPTNMTPSPSIEAVAHLRGPPFSTWSHMPFQGGLDATLPTPPYVHTNLVPPPKGPIVYGPGPIPTGRQDWPGAAASASLSNAHASSLRVAYQDQTASWREGHQAEPLASAADRLQGARNTGDGYAFKIPLSTSLGEVSADRTQPYLNDTSVARATQAMFQARAGTIQPGTQLVYSDGSTSPRMPALHQYHSGAYQMPVYLPLGIYSTTQSLNDERDAKRIRIEPPNRGHAWSPGKETRPGRQWLSSDDWQFASTWARFGEPCPVSDHIHSHLPAAEALASIQSIEPLTDESYSSSGSDKKGKGKGKGRASTDSSSSTNTSTSLSSMAAEEDGDEDFVDDNGGDASD